MKSILVPSLLAILAATAPAVEPAAEEPEAPALAARIVSVTLYSTQALVVRRGAVDLAPGRSRLEVPGLPAALSSETVRARIVDGKGARIATIEVRERNRTLFKKAEAEEAEKAVKAISARRAAAADSIAALDREAALVKGLQIGKAPEGKPEKPTPAPIDPAAWKATLDFVDAALAENRKRARDLAAELDGIDEELAVAQARFERVRSAKVRAEKAVAIEFEAEAAGRAEVEVAYLVPGPGWWPRYDVRADPEKRKIEVTSYAIVRQETGEDWTGVDLEFSAAEPARAADLPKMLAWRIGEAPAGGAQVASSSSAGQSQQAEQAILNLTGNFTSVPVELPQVQQAGQEKVLAAGKAARTKQVLKNIESQRKLNDLAFNRGDWGNFVLGNTAIQEEISNLDARFQTYFADDLAEASSNIAKGERMIRTSRLCDGLVPPVRSSRGYDYKYRALRPETIPSDGAFNKVVIGIEDLPAEFGYETAPEKRELAFLASRVRNGRRQPYLEGPASVFLGSDFIGDGRVPTTSRGEVFPVELGADESISVKRRAEKKRETTGLFTSWHKYLHEVEVTVKNGKARAARITVIERIPFTEDSKVEVERVALDPPPAREERKGLLAWDIDLKPGEERKVKIAYTVEVPADRQPVAVEDPSVKW